MANLSDTAPARVTIRASNVRLAALFVVSCLFVVGGVWMLRDGNAVGWFEIAFFGLCAIVMAVSFLRDTGLDLDEEGFTMATLWRSSRFEWRDVSPFVVGSVAAQAMILFDDRRQGNLSDVNRRLTDHNCAIPSVMISGPIQNVCEQLNEFRTRALNGEFDA